MRIVLKPGTRTWVFCSHQCLKHRHKAMFFLPFSGVYPDPCAQLPRDWGSTARVERPSLCAWETLLRCGKVVGFVHLPGNAWSPGQKWSPTMLDTHDSAHGLLTQGGAWLQCFALLTQPHWWSRMVTGWRVTALKPGNKQYFALYSEVFRGTCIFH